MASASERKLAGLRDALHALDSFFSNDGLRNGSRLVRIAMRVIAPEETTEEQQTARLHFDRELE